MTPVIASAHVAHSGADSISSGASVSSPRTAIDRDRPITMALLRAMLVVEALGGTIEFGCFDASAVFILQISADMKSNTRMVLVTQQVTSHLSDSGCGTGGVDEYIAVSFTTVPTTRVGSAIHRRHIVGSLCKGVTL